MEISRKLEGLSRHASTHAAGIVIGREELAHYVPLYRDARTGAVSTQYSMDFLEECGLVKMDFLGLKTLTLIRNTLGLLARRGVELSRRRSPRTTRPPTGCWARGAAPASSSSKARGCRGCSSGPARSRSRT